MNRKHLISAGYCLLLAGVGFFGGCAKHHEHPLGSCCPEGYILDFVESQPTSPAILDKGQKLTVIAYYTIPPEQTAQVWARPYLRGQRIAGYSAHPLIPVGGDQPAEGMAEMWFLFEEPAVIDEIRLTMKNRGNDTIVVTISQPVEIRWKEEH